MNTYRSDNIRQFFVDERDARTFPVSAIITYPKIGVAGTVKRTEVEDIAGLVSLIDQAAERQEGSASQEAHHMARKAKGGIELAVEMIPINKVLRYANNAREHSDAQIEQIAASIREFGFVNPCLVDADGVLIAGHGHVAGAQKAGLAEVPIIRLGHLTDTQARALRLADNAIALNSTWNEDMLRLELTDLKIADYDLNLTGFDDIQLVQFLANVPTGADPEAVPEPPPTPVTKRGDLWLLGNHRLLCGDATSAEDVARLLDGAKPNLMVTNPPYGIELDMEWRDERGHNEMAPASRSYMKQAMAGHGISGDTIADWSTAFELVPSINVAYVWHASMKTVDVANGLERIGLRLRQHIVWVKTVAAMSRSAYHWQHEPCWYAVREGKTASWVGSHDQSTIWEAASPKHIMSGSKEEKYDHPTQKPVILYTRPIENHTKMGDVVYEPFSGSGSAIAACEMIHRHAIAMEIEPRFVDVDILRWQGMTGKQARHASTGLTYAEERDARTKPAPKRKRAPGSPERV